MAYGSPGASHLRFPADLTWNTDYAGNYMMFTAMKVSGGVDTRTLKFDYAAGSPGVVCLPIPQNLTAAYQNNWDQQEVGGFMAAGGSNAQGIKDFISKVSTEKTMTGMLGAAVGAGKDFISDSFKGLQAAGSDIGGTAYQNNWDQSEVGGMMSAGVSAATGIVGAIEKVTTQPTVTGMIGAAAGEAGKFAGDAWSNIKAAGTDVSGTANKMNAAGAGIANEMMAKEDVYTNEVVEYEVLMTSDNGHTEFIHRVEKTGKRSI